MPANNAKGWICLHRKLLDHPCASDPGWVAVWIYLLLNATHKPHKALFNGKLVTLKPGQLIAGRFKIGELTGVNSSKVQRVLRLLKSDHQIDQQPGAKSSIITILNWHLYQTSDHQIDQLAISSRSHYNKQIMEIMENKIRTDRARLRPSMFNPLFESEDQFINAIIRYGRDRGLNPDVVDRFLNYNATRYNTLHDPMKALLGFCDKVESDRTGRTESERISPEENNSPGWQIPPGWQIEKIYSYYPRKEGRKEGIAAITEAIKKFGYVELLERTEAYAKFCDGRDTNLCPLPFSWFNSEDYKKPPERWDVYFVSGKGGV